MSRPAGIDRDSPRRLGFHYGYVILGTGILIVTGALGFARFGYATILPSMKEGLLLNNTQMGMIATANLVGYTVFSVAGGYFASRFGPRLVIGCSMFLTGAAMFLTGTAGGFSQAAVFRFLTGMGSAGSNIPVMGLASSWFGPRRRGTAAGFLVGGSGLAFLATGYFIPRIMAAWEQNGWRYSWFILGSVVILLGILGWTLLRNDPAEKGLKPIGENLPGLQQLSHSGGRNAGCSARTKAGRKAEGGRSLSLGRIYLLPELWHLGAVYFFFGFSYIIYGTFFSEAMVSDKGFSQSQAGSVWSIIGVIGIFSGIIWGAASDRIGRKLALAIVFGLQASSFLLFAAAHTPGMMYISAFLYGLSAFSIPGIVAAACGDCVGPGLAPAALGMVTLFFSIGQAAAPSVAGYLADSARSFGSAFILATLVAATGSIVSLTLRQPKYQA